VLRQCQQRATGGGRGAFDRPCTKYEDQLEQFAVRQPISIFAGQHQGADNVIPGRGTATLDNALYRSFRRSEGIDIFLRERIVG